jgi:Spy/CpxP family protein refolding chaperone
MRMIRFVMAGLLVAGLVVMAEAQQRGFGGGGPQWGPTQLIVAEVVQKDLKLSDEQIEKVKTWSEAQKAKAGEGKGAGKGGGNFKNMTKEERQELFEKMAAQAAESRKAAYKDLAGVLKPEQLARLKQIELQANGIQAFQSDETIAALMLTDSQKSKVKEIMSEFQKDRREVFGGGGGGKGGFDKEKMAENQKKVDKLEKTAFGDIEESLTADQKKAWKELTGEPFDRSKLPLFAGFGGGGGNKGKNKAKD